MNIGIDVGGTKILGGLVSNNGDVVARIKTKTDLSNSPDIIINQIIALVKKLLRENNITTQQLAAVGVGIPGLIDPSGATVIFAPNIGWKNVELKKRLEQEIGIWVTLDNDVNLGTFGELWKGSGAGYQDVVGVFAGTGVGGAVIVDGHIWRGKNNMAGEIGHMIVKPDGEKCNCGNQGCLEAYAGKLGIAGRLKAAGITWEGMLKSSFLAEAIKKDNIIVKKEMKNVAFHLGIGIANLASIFNPQAIILGGGMIEACNEYLLPRIKKYIKEHSFNQVKVLIAALGDDAGIIGAARAASLKA